MTPIAQLLLNLISTDSAANTGITSDNSLSDLDSSDKLLFFNLLETFLQAENTESPDMAAPASTNYSQASNSGPVEQIIDKAASKYGVNQQLIKEVIRAESSFNQEAVSSAGAQGLMQLMPATAAAYGVTNPLDPSQNINAGTHLIRDLLNQFQGNVSLALAAYNAGSGAVQKYHGIPPYAETKAYVSKIISRLDGIDKKV